MITADALRDALSYDPLTGKFTWKMPRRKIVVGAEAGFIDRLGYRHIRIDLKLYRAARLAFLYMTGEWPSDEIDHINCVRDDNAWSNLREANRSQNTANRRTKNATGFRGVFLHRKTGLYRAEIRKDGRAKSLGYFKSPEDAHAAYVAAGKTVHGEFFRAA